MVNIRITWCLKWYNLLSFHQCGYIKHHPTTDQLVHLEYTIETCMRDRKQYLPFLLTLKSLWYNMETQYFATALKVEILGEPSKLPLGTFQTEWGGHLCRSTFTNGHCQGQRVCTPLIYTPFGGSSMLSTSRRFATCTESLSFNTALGNASTDYPPQQQIGTL